MSIEADLSSLAIAEVFADARATSWLIGVLTIGFTAFDS
jgi:hypothetical protein